MKNITRIIAIGGGETMLFAEAEMAYCDGSLVAQ